MSLIISDLLAENCGRTPARRAWLELLPGTISELQKRWSLSPAAPLRNSEASCSWVWPALRKDGTKAVLKLGIPHLEGEDEIQGLRFWQGDPTVHLLEADETLNAMLLERCEPGSLLRQRPANEQDVVIAGLLHRLWRRTPPPQQFRPLSAMTAYWARETMADRARWPDTGLVKEGLRLFDELPRSATKEVLLATDLHAGNVLQAQREPWLVIDPKPFVGDPAYDATQHLINCEARMRANPKATIRRFAELLEVDHERVRLWMFARSAAEPRDRWDEETIALAKTLS